ncbi:unnamed protein product [Phytophthora fragariaefolia]|uniref:Unnamed protein product n=1 Tax=Phytophthora fragariaefolia TaxID=1490495 RepID=A0A9W6WJ25_9STRA|nr:unnamed protein product [Phytophthora fragariaefolia]
MGAFEMEKVFDLELASWKDLIRSVTGPIDWIDRDRQTYRLRLSGWPPRLPRRTQTSKALEDAIIRLMQSTTMRTTNVPASSGPAPIVRTTPPATTLREPVDVYMKSVSSQSTPRSKRQACDQDEAPEDLIDL